MKFYEISTKLTGNEGKTIEVIFYDIDHEFGGYGDHHILIQSPNIEVNIHLLNNCTKELYDDIVTAISVRSFKFLKKLFKVSKNYDELELYEEYDNLIEYIK